MKKIILPITLFVFASCTQSEIEPESIQDDGLWTPKIHRCDDAKHVSDSLTRISKMQSDHDILMMNSILYSQGKYQLCLTIEDASMMGIPDVTYSKYAAIVSKYNNK